MIYVVTDGNYSEYTIHGVFTCTEKAEAFRSHYNYDQVEDYEENPETPTCDLNMFFGQYVSDVSDVNVMRVRRLSNDCKTMDNSIYQVAYSKGWHFTCQFSAKDLTHAQEILHDRVRAFKAGSTSATRHRTETEACGPSMRNSRYIYFTDTYMIVEGKLTVVSTEPR